MIRRWYRKINQGWQGMHEAAILLGVFSLISQLIGLFRDRMLAHIIGPSATLDVYYAAFRIPDLIFLSIASLASITVLMPFIIERMDGEGKDAARRFFNEVLSGFLIMLTVVSVIVFLLMPYIARLIAPGFSPVELHQLVWVSRIMLFSPIFLGLSSLLGTITQLLRKFFVFSLSPIIYNLGILLGLLVLYPRYGVYGLAAGVAFGALLHMLIQLPTVIKAGFSPKLTERIRHSTLKQVITLSLPRTLGLSMNSIALLVIVAIGSTLGTGSISIFNFSLNLETTPVGIIGISYAVASFPMLAESFARGKMAEWEEYIYSAVRQIIFWSLPLTALFVVIRAQIVRVTLGSGAFSWTDTKLTAAAFALFTVGLIGQNMILVSVRAFYSAHNTKTPLIINTICSVFIVASAIGLIHLFNDNYAFRHAIESLLRVEDTPGTVVLMLPLAYSLGTLLNAWLHWIDLRRNYLKTSGHVMTTFFQSFVASLALGIVSYLTLNAFGPFTRQRTFWSVFLEGGVATFTGILAAVIVLYLFKDEQFLELVSALRQKFWKTDLTDPEKEPAS